MEGKQSVARALKHQVFQGTVLGPPLWNCFYADTQIAVGSEGFEAPVFADDLNAFKDFPATTDNEEVFSELTQCQKSLHSWGGANKVTFDPSKESFHVSHRTKHEGSDFKTLGCTFDCQLTMARACRKTAKEGRWRLRVLLRSRRFFSTQQLLQLYKTHILSFLENTTPALFHAAASHLDLIDHMQEVFCGKLVSQNEKL